MSKPQSFFHLHLISDSTGETLLAAGRAASAQYKDARAIEHIYPLIRTEKQLAKVMHYVEIGQGEGARLACGGKRLTSGALAHGCFHEPTVFVDVTPDESPDSWSKCHLEPSSRLVIAGAGMIGIAD